MCKEVARMERERCVAFVRCGGCLNRWPALADRLGHHASLAGVRGLASGVLEFCGRWERIRGAGRFMGVRGSSGSGGGLAASGGATDVLATATPCRGEHAGGGERLGGWHAGTRGGRRETTTVALGHAEQSFWHDIVVVTMCVHALGHFGLL